MLGGLRLRPFKAAFAYQFDRTLVTSLDVPTFYRERNDKIRVKRMEEKKVNKLK